MSDLDKLIEKSRALVSKMSSDERQQMFKAQAESWARSCTNVWTHRLSDEDLITEREIWLERTKGSGAAAGTATEFLEDAEREMKCRGLL